MTRKITKKCLDICSPIVFFVLMAILIYSGYEQKFHSEATNINCSFIAKSSSNLLSTIDLFGTRIEELALEEIFISDSEMPIPLASMPSEEQSIDRYIYEIVETRYPSLDPELVRAIVYHESRYDPGAINPSSGTIGLMQINPKWHTERARSLGVNDLTDPYGNLLVGCDLLTELIKTYSQNYALNVYAGGYTYADSYKRSESPYVQEIYKIRTSLRNGSIVPGR